MKARMDGLKVTSMVRKLMNSIILMGINRRIISKM